MKTTKRKTLPVVDYDKKKNTYTFNGSPIGTIFALECWESGGCEWSESAYLLMSQNILNEK